MTTTEQLADRYGRTSARTVRTWIIAIAALGAIAAGAIAWVVLSTSARSVDVDDLGYAVVSEHEVEVSYRVTSAHQEDVVCVVEALDETFAIVGWEIVELPNDGSVSTDHQTTVQTLDTATTGYVRTCSLR